MRNHNVLTLCTLFALCLGVPACGASSASPVPDPTEDEGPDAPEDVSDLTAAKVTLRVPVLDERGQLLSKHNAALTAAGLGTFPDFVEIDGGAKGAIAKGATKKWDDAGVLADKANEKNVIDVAMRSYEEPHNYRTRDPKTTICYRGNPLLVVSLIRNLASSVFSDQLGFHGWRYRDTKKLDENLTPEDEANFPKIWKAWRGKGAAILVVTHSSDDGSEMNVGIIPKCAAP